MAKALDLDEGDKKHWYYKIKREYEEIERLKKQMYPTTP